MLAAAYLALIPLLISLDNVPKITLLLVMSAVACLIVFYAREARSLRLPTLPAPLDAALAGLGRIPAVVLWLPLPVSLSWVAGEMARVPANQADYYLAFGVWVAALAAFLAIFLVPVAAVSREELGAFVRRIPWPEVAAVAAITGVAFALRFINLADQPGPFWADEGDDAIAGLEVARGFRDNLFDMGIQTTQPNLYYATMGLPFKLFGPSVLWARLPTAIAGTLTVPLFYLLLREIFDRRVALAGGAFLAVFNMHFHYSRMAFPNPYDALFAVLVLYFALRAIRSGSLADFGAAGLSAGLIFYFFMGGRAVLLALAALLAFMVLRTLGKFVPRNFWGLTVLVAGFVVAFLPAGLYFDGTPDAFTARWESQNIFDTGWLDERVELTGHSELHVLWDQFQQTIGTMVVYDDTIAHYNSREPLLDALSAVFFVVGGVYALFHLFQPRFFALFAVLLLTAVFGNALLVPPVGSHRLLAAVPVMAAFVGLGLVVTAEAVAWIVPRLRPLAPVAVVGALAVIAVINIGFYFDTYVDTENFGRGRHLSGADVADYLERFDNSYAAYVLDTGGLSGREPALRFRQRDRVIVDVREDGAGSIFIEGRAIHRDELAAGRYITENTLFLVPIDRTNGPPEHVREFRIIKQACPGGKTSDVFSTGAADVILYVWYEVRHSQECIEALRGTVLPELPV